MTNYPRYAILEILQGKVPLWFAGYFPSGLGLWHFHANKAVTFDSHLDAKRVVDDIVKRGHNLSKDPLYIVPTPSFKRSPSLNPSHWRKRKSKRTTPYDEVPGLPGRAPYADGNISREAVDLDEFEIANQEVVLRPELRQFAEALEFRLRANDHKEGWDKLSVDNCLRRFHAEAHELDEVAYAHSEHQSMKEEILHESEDAANYLFFLWWNAKRELT